MPSAIIYPEAVIVWESANLFSFGSTTGGFEFSEPTPVAFDFSAPAAFQLA